MGLLGIGKSIAIFRRIRRQSDDKIGFCPSFNGYGSQEEIEEKYELLVPQEEFNNYDSWNDIFKLIEK